MAKNWRLGKHITALGVYVGTRNASTGAVTWGTVASMLGLVDYVRFNADFGLEMIASLDASFAHNEPTLQNSSMSLGEILDKSTVAKLTALVTAGPYVKVVFTFGASTATFHGVIANYNDGATAYGKNTCEITLAPFDDGTNTPGLVIT